MPSSWSKNGRLSRAMPTKITQQKRTARRRIWRPKRILAGELARRGASETVKLTVVGDGRRIRRRPGIVDRTRASRPHINPHVDPRRQFKLGDAAQPAVNSTLVLLRHSVHATLPGHVLCSSWLPLTSGLTCRVPTHLLVFRSATMGDRSRSRSPRPRDEGGRDRPKKTGGFRWKEKRRDDDSRDDNDRGLDRGYRDRGDRPRSPRRDRPSNRYEDRPGDRDRRRDDRDAPREDREKKKKEKKEKKPVVPQSSEPMIVVHVNDRLGTKAAIPCLASDPISRFPAFYITMALYTDVLFRTLQGSSSCAHRP